MARFGLAHQRTIRSASGSGGSTTTPKKGEVEEEERKKKMKKPKPSRGIVFTISLRHSSELTSWRFTSEDNQQLDVGSCRSGQRPSRARTNSEGSAGMTARSTVSAPPPPMGAFHFHSLQKIEGGKKQKRKEDEQSRCSKRWNVRPQCGSKGDGMERKREKSS